MSEIEFGDFIAAGFRTCRFISELGGQDRRRGLSEFQVVVVHLQSIAAEDQETAALSEKILDFCNDGVRNRCDVAKHDYLIGVQRRGIQPVGDNDRWKVER